MSKSEGAPATRVASDAGVRGSVRVGAVRRADLSRAQVRAALPRERRRPGRGLRALCGGRGGRGRGGRAPTDPLGLAARAARARHSSVFLFVFLLLRQRALSLSLSLFASVCCFTGSPLLSLVASPVCELGRRLSGEATAARAPACALRPLASVGRGHKDLSDIGTHEFDASGARGLSLAATPAPRSALGVLKSNSERGPRETGVRRPRGASSGGSARSASTRRSLAAAPFFCTKGSDLVESRRFWVLPLRVGGD